MWLEDINTLEKWNYFSKVTKQVIKKSKSAAEKIFLKGDNAKTQITIGNRKKFLIYFTANTLLIKRLDVKERNFTTIDFKTYVEDYKCWEIEKEIYFYLSRLKSIHFLNTTDKI